MRTLLGVKCVHFIVSVLFLKCLDHGIQTIQVISGHSSPTSPKMPVIFCVGMTLTHVKTILLVTWAGPTHA